MPRPAIRQRVLLKAFLSHSAQTEVKGSLRHWGRDLPESSESLSQDNGLQITPASCSSRWQIARMSVVTQRAWNLLPDRYLLPARSSRPPTWLDLGLNFALFCTEPQFLFPVHVPLSLHAFFSQDSDLLIWDLISIFQNLLRRFGKC